MDLMKLVAKIELDDSSYKKGIKNAESSAENFKGSLAEKGQAVKEKLSAMTVAFGQLVADMVKKGISAIKSLVNNSIGGYADYQQLVGGVETLFKNSANKVKRYAEQSFKTTGLSANQYMETVTGFSASLLQGLKGDTEEAAKMADMAITDMADNANKMGTDISSIQNAYQGFAKQNYTMLDNLKLGYGGTASEMVRLVNDSKILDHEIENLDGITFDQLVQAIHVVQTEMGVTGTTAKEAAETISGSKASLAAAWSDLLVAVAGTDKKDVDAYHNPLGEALEKFKTSFTTYVENVVPTVVKSIANSGDLVQGIAESIASLPTDLLSKVGDEALPAGTKMVGGVSKIVHWMIESLTKMTRSAAQDSEGMADFGKALGEFIGTTIADLVKYAPEILANITTLGFTLSEGLIEGLFKGLFGEGAEVDKITEQLEKDITDIDLNNNQATGILRYMDKLYEKYGNGVTRMAEWKQAQKELEEALPAAGKVFQNYGSDIEGALDTLNKLNESMRQNAIVAGLEKAVHDMRELYGQQVAEASAAEIKIEQTKEQRQTAVEGVSESLKAYASEYILHDLEAALEQRGFGLEDKYGNRTAEVMLQQLLENGEFSEGYQIADYNLADMQLQSALNMLRTGKAYLDDEYGNTHEIALEDLTSDQIRKIANMFVPAYGNGEEAIWDQSVLDNIYSPEELEKFADSIDGYNTVIEEQTTKMEEANKQADATYEQIQLTQVAWERSIKERAERGGVDIQEAGEAYAKAMQDAAESLGIVTAGWSMPRAVGIDYVPTNGWRAELHRGEAVLTAAENAERRNGGGNAEVVGAIQGMRQDLQNLRLVVGQKNFGRAVVDYGGRGVNDYIGKSNSQEAAGYGT